MVAQLHPSALCLSGPWQSCCCRRPPFAPCPGGVRLRAPNRGSQRESALSASWDFCARPHPLHPPQLRPSLPSAAGHGAACLQRGWPAAAAALRAAPTLPASEKCSCRPAWSIALLSSSSPQEHFSFAGSLKMISSLLLFMWHPVSTSQLHAPCPVWHHGHGKLGCPPLLRKHSPPAGYAVPEKGKSRPLAPLVHMAVGKGAHSPPTNRQNRNRSKMLEWLLPKHYNSTAVTLSNRSKY